MNREILTMADTIVTSIKTYVSAQMGAVRTRLDTFSQRLDGVEERTIALGKRDPLVAKGEVGPQGPQGDVGPMPMHRWDGTALAFQQGPDGDTWGEAVDLQGPRGHDGVTQVIAAPGLGAAQPTNAYFPTGW